MNNKQRSSLVIGNHGFSDSRNMSLDGHDDGLELTVEQLDKELDEYARERRRLLAVKRVQEAKERYALIQELESALAAEEEALKRDLDIFRHDGQRAVPFFHSMTQANDVQAMMF
ncbi:hypothetical protein BJV82DRAFT_665708 [Fennellomyces sp. T-0311]|nr:hypothetical protein BJV82DRAFT_665708 [Fennellomyces sp. T-0311]